MRLLKKNLELLNSYHNLIGQQENWPYYLNLQGNLEFNPETIRYEIGAYWNLYKEIFNNPLPGTVSNPIEKHPYIDRFPLSNSRKNLVIGTFPPFSYVTDSRTLPIFPSQLIDTQVGRNRIEGTYSKHYEDIRPNVLYYYGNVGTFWDYVPGFGETLNLYSCLDWQETFETNITDIIKYCQRKNITDSSDSNLYNIVPNFEIVQNILESDNIENVFFTSGYPTINFLKENNTSAFSLFFKTLDMLQVNYQFGVYPNGPFIDNHITTVLNKALFFLKLGDGKQEKIIKIICLPSPSGQMSRVMKHHPFYYEFINGLHYHNYPGLPLTKAFRMHIYDLAFNNNFDSLDLLQ